MCIRDRGGGAWQGEVGWTILDAAGNIVNEAKLPIVETTFGSSWPLIRLTSFVILNAALAYVIYGMFKKIGVFGNKVTSDA